MKGYCRGACDGIRATFNRTAGGYYLLGYKKCTFCDQFIEHDGNWCPCCNRRLRSKPICNRSRKKLIGLQGMHYY